MKNEIVGVTVLFEILVGEKQGKEMNKILCDIENKVSDYLEENFDCKVIGGKGGYIYVDNENRLIK